MASSSGFTFPDPPSTPTPMDHLLHSNAPPNSIEAGLTTSYIGELESQIVLLDEALASLQLRSVDLVQSVKTHKPILSPIRRIPPEILGEIFALVVRKTFYFGDISEVAPPVTQHAPWLFTRICRRWSDVALATPALWSMIFLDFDRAGGRGAVRLTNTCLQRSANMPLTIKIFQEVASQTSHLLLAAALSSSERWEVADLDMQPWLFQKMAIINGSFPALKTLLVCVDLNLNGDEDEDEEFESLNEAFWKTFAVAPQLRSLQALSWMDDFRRTPFHLPWHQLTRLSTTFTSNTEALVTLRQLSDIIECTFAISKTEILPVDYGTIHLPHLRSLALQIETDTHDPVDTYQKHTSLLDFLETPCLQELITYKTADEAAVLGLVARSNCAASLESLNFHADSVDHSVMLRLAQKLPYLTTLVIGDFDGTLLPVSPVSPVPVFIQTFSKQWIGARKTFPNHPRQIEVRIVDRRWSQQAVRDITPMLLTMDKDGLFFGIVPYPAFPQIIFERFGYY
ncbi:hypothetical protein B0H14DRAFT_1622197 [Mycena olivaceomarginata]|nr:hypothetical protein B0H14DRAFT_1622197 [Mycena olivaceomarginata]